MQNFDRLAFFIFKALAFGLIAAATGIVAFLVLQESESNTDAIQGLIDTNTETLSLEIGELRSEVAAVQNAIPAAGPSNEEIAELKASLASLRTDVENYVRDSGGKQLETQERVSTTEQHIGVLEQKNSELESRLASIAADSVVEFEAAESLEQRLGELELRVSAFEAVGTSAALEAVGETPVVVAIETVELSAEIERIANRLAEIESILQAPKDSPDLQPAIDGLSERVAELESSQLDASEFTGLETRVSAVESDVEILQSEQQQPVALTSTGLGFAGIRAAIETGAPYSALIADVGLESGDLSQAFMAHADTGVATLAELRSGFPEYARAAIRAEGTSEEGGSILGFLQSLVTVRSLEPQEGTGVAAIVSRAEAALKRNELDAAIVQLGDLPAEVRGEFEDWIRAAEARSAVLEAFDDLANSQVQTEGAP